MVTFRIGVVVVFLVAFATATQAAPESEVPDGGAPVDAGVAPASLFETWFPRIAGGYRINDFDLYAALMKRDLISFASLMSESIKKELEDLADKPYQREKVHHRIRADRNLTSMFEAFRQKLATAVVYYKTESSNGLPELVYVRKEFRLVVGNDDLGDLPAVTLIAPNYGRLAYPFGGEDVSLGKWSRAVCWRDADGQGTCGARLPDMPARLKDVIEDQFGKTISVRWRWRGFPVPARTRLVDFSGRGQLVAIPAVVRIPSELALEFLDKEGNVIWAAR
jgi:hypothetical protein